MNPSLPFILYIYSKMGEKKIRSVFAIKLHIKPDNPKTNTRLTLSSLDNFPAIVSS